MMQIILSGVYDVVTASDGEDAIQKMDRGLQPDAIVTDLIMPRMDGYELISRIKKDQKHKNIPIIVLSSVDKMARQHKLKHQRICGYIVKPMHAATLKNSLSHSLEEVLHLSN